MAGRDYVGVVRPFLRAWWVGILVSGGACIALSRAVARVGGESLVVERLDQFGLLLVYLSALLLTAEATLVGASLRTAPTRPAPSDQSPVRPL